MKWTSLLVVTVAGNALAKSHSHQHQKRDRVVVYKNVVEQACRLAGTGGTVLRNLAYADCRAGLANGTYKALGGGQFPFRAASTLITKTIIEQPTPPPKVAPDAARDAAPVTATPKPAVAPSPPPMRVPYIGQAISTEQSAYPMLHEDFPDGTIPCTTFPDNWAVRTPWQNLEGWASIQKFSGKTPEGRLLGLDNQVNTGCMPSAYCSYNCPEGMLKAQWPEEHQGATGQSVGGLECRENGYLYTSRPQVTRKLCDYGSTRASAFIHNQLDQVVSICATNYPGDEAETMWLEVPPGQTKQLAVVDQASYYRSATEGKGTSRQYYLNRKGYPAQKACRWGTKTEPVGNWAPINVGLGWAPDDKGYFSLFNNAPTQQHATLGYNVVVEGGDMPCNYDNKNITYGALSWKAFGETAEGCTVGVAPHSRVVYNLIAS